MKKVFLLSFCLLNIVYVFAQKDYLKLGNQALEKNEYTRAEYLFKQARQADSNSTVIKTQLGLSYLKQHKFQEAEDELSKSLGADSNNIPALWYSGISNNMLGNYQACIDRFESVLAKEGLNRKPQTRNKILEFESRLKELKVDSGDYHLAMLLIGKSYAGKLKSTGVNNSEANRMFNCFNEYLRLQGKTETASHVKGFIDYYEERRPEDKNAIWVEKWIEQEEM